MTIRDSLSPIFFLFTSIRILILLDKYKAYDEIGLTRLGIFQNVS